MVLHVIVIYQTKISCNSRFVHQKTQGVGLQCCTDHVLTQTMSSPSTSAELISVWVIFSDLPGVETTRPSPGEEIPQGLMEDSSIFWCLIIFLVIFSWKKFFGILYVQIWLSEIRSYLTCASFFSNVSGKNDHM